MHTIYSIRQRILISLSLLTLCVLAFTLVGCGAAGAGGTGSGATSPTSTRALTVIKGYGTTNGCPSDTVVQTAQTKANVLLRSSDANSTVTAHSGDIIEVRLPFGDKWRGPITSQGVLQLQSPPGYAWKTDSVCIWRFVAQGTGSVQLNFTGQALCKKGQMCAMFIMAIPIKIDVK